MNRALKVLMLNTIDGFGGAALAAGTLGDNLRKLGHDVELMVGTKNTRNHYVVTMPRFDTLLNDFRGSILDFGARSPGRIGDAAKRRKGRIMRNMFPNIPAEGRDYLGFQGSWRVIPKYGRRPDILHAHNLHGGYFDLRALPEISHRAPTVLTLHDAWLTAGHCAHSFACERWRSGCGACPDLSIPVAIDRDRSALNWKDKAELLIRSRVWVTTPSQWLLDKVNASYAGPAARKAMVIPNGVDRTIFNGQEREGARERLGLPKNARIIMFAANGIRESVWKDFGTLRRALELLPLDAGAMLLAVGEDGLEEKVGNSVIRFVPPIPMGSKLADYFRAADLYVHASRADTFPNVILEALSCGTPVVASAVGGIPEQIRGLDATMRAPSTNIAKEKPTGILVSPGKPEDLAAAIVHILADDSLRHKIGKAAEVDIAERFDILSIVRIWEDFYREIRKEVRPIRGG